MTVERCERCGAILVPTIVDPKDGQFQDVKAKATLAHKGREMSKAMKNKAIAPCPLCGGVCWTAVDIPTDPADGYDHRVNRVVCKNLDCPYECRQYAFAMSMEQVIAARNKCVGEQSLAKERDEMREMLAKLHRNGAFCVAKYADGQVIRCLLTECGCDSPPPPADCPIAKFVAKPTVDAAMEVK